MMTNSATRSLRVWDGTGSPQFGQYTAVKGTARKHSLQIVATPPTSRQDDGGQ